LTPNKVQLSAEFKLPLAFNFDANPYFANDYNPFAFKEELSGNYDFCKFGDIVSTTIPNDFLLNNQFIPDYSWNQMLIDMMLKMFQSNSSLPNYDIDIGTRSNSSSLRSPSARSSSARGSGLSSGRTSSTLSRGTISGCTYVPARTISNKTCNNDYIVELDPQMQEKVRALEEYARENNIPFKIIDGYRSREKQLQLIERYKNQPGRAAGADKSKHRFGKAIDIQTDNYLTEEQCRKLGEYAKSIGMRWGGDFRTVRERWHFEIA